MRRHFLSWWQPRGAITQAQHTRRRRFFRVVPLTPIQSCYHFVQGYNRDWLKWKSRSVGWTWRESATVTFFLSRTLGDVYCVFFYRYSRERCMRRCGVSGGGHYMSRDGLRGQRYLRGFVNFSNTVFSNVCKDFINL